MQGAILGVVRAILSALGGYLVGAGYVDSDTATSITGALTTLGVAVWSVIEKRQQATKTAVIQEGVATAATLPEAKAVSSTASKVP